MKITKSIWICVSEYMFRFFDCVIPQFRIFFLILAFVNSNLHRDLSKLQTAIIVNYLLLWWQCVFYLKKLPTDMPWRSEWFRFNVCIPIPFCHKVWRKIYEKNWIKVDTNPQNNCQETHRNFPTPTTFNIVSEMKTNPCQDLSEIAMI